MSLRLRPDLHRSELRVSMTPILTLLLAVVLLPSCSDEPSTTPGTEPPTAGSIEDFAGGLDRSVTVLTLHDGELIVGGDFRSSREDGSELNGIARLRDGHWEAIGGSLTGGVQALLSWDGSIVAGGFFNRRQQASADHLCRWDGTEWMEFVGGVSGAVTALLEYRGDLIVAGRFDQAGHTNSPYIARFSNGGWYPMERGVDAPVAAVALHQTRLYAAGAFTYSGTGNPIAGVARWSDEAWVPVDGGIDGTVADLASYRGRLVAGGTFDLAGTVYAKNVAMLGEHGWEPMGRGLDGPVLSLAVIGDCLYAAGLFGRSGDSDVSSLARWTGRSWQPVIGVVQGTLTTCFVHEDRLVLGGNLSSIEGESMGNIAAIDPGGCDSEPFRTPQETGPGLLRNWDVEDPLADGDDEWFYFDAQNTGYQGRVDDDIAHTGVRSLRIEGPVQRQGFGYWGQIVRTDLPFGRPILVEGWIRTERVQGRGAAIAIRADGPEGVRFFQSTEAIRPLRGTTDWTLCRVGIPELPTDTERVAVYLVLSGSAGTAWFDRISMTAVE